MVCAHPIGELLITKRMKPGLWEDLRGLTIVPPPQEVKTKDWKGIFFETLINSFNSTYYMYIDPNNLFEL